VIISFYGKIYSLSKFIINPILVTGCIDCNFPIAIHHPIPRPKPNTHITPVYFIAHSRRLRRLDKLALGKLITILDHYAVAAARRPGPPRDYERFLEDPGYSPYS